MKKSLSIFLIFFVACSFINAQTTTTLRSSVHGGVENFTLNGATHTPASEKIAIRGKIVDKETKNPLIAVNIFDEKTKEGTVTELDGTFEFDVYQDFSKVLTISYAGYHKQKIKITDPDQIINIELERNPNTIECELANDRSKRNCWKSRSQRKKSEKKNIYKTHKK